MWLFSHLIPIVCHCLNHWCTIWLTNRVVLQNYLWPAENFPAEIPVKNLDSKDLSADIFFLRSCCRFQLSFLKQKCFDGLRRSRQTNINYFCPNAIKRYRLQQQQQLFSYILFFQIRRLIRGQLGVTAAEKIVRIIGLASFYLVSVKPLVITMNRRCHC